MRNNYLLMVAALVLAGCNESGEGGHTNPNVQSCIDRGVKYFKEIDAWPRLSSGQDALDVATERCGRTTTAFP